MFEEFIGEMPKKRKKPGIIDVGDFVRVWKIRLGPGHEQHEAFGIHCPVEGHVVKCVGYPRNGGWRDVNGIAVPAVKYAYYEVSVLYQQNGEEVKKFVNATADSIEMIELRIEDKDTPINPMEALVG